MIALASLVKAFPRLASAAAFLCLIEDHLECPDIACDSMSRQMAEELSERRRGSGFAATIVVAAMLVAALSMWTAIPLTWIYIGSKLSKTQFPSGGPYMIVLVGIVVSILIVAWLIGRLNHLYVRITGTNSVNPIALRLAAQHARHARDADLDDRRGGDRRFGAAGRGRSDALVPAARRLAALPRG